MRNVFSKLMLICLLAISIISNTQAQNFALGFDGSNDYASLPSSVQPSGSNFTAEAWIFLESGGGSDQKLLFSLTWGPAKGYALNIYNDGNGYYFNATVYVGGTAYWSPASSFIPLNTWTHVAMTWASGGNISTYLNGSLVGSTSTGSSSYTSSGSTVFLGAGSSSWAHFKGRIDEVRIWNSTRTQSEIQNSMYRTLTGTETNLAHYYKMSDGSGTTLTDNKSGGSANGTLYNGVVWTDGLAVSTFTNASATGAYGPTQEQVNSAYTGTSLSGKVTVNTQGIQEWTVPSSGIYNIVARGARGGANYYTQRVKGGYGSEMAGNFSLTAGQVLKIVVGQVGLDGAVDDYATNPGQLSGGSGGGGTFVTLSDNTPLIVAGGGGGATTRLSYDGQVGGDALTGTSGGDGVTATPGLGGTNGSGGGGCSNSGYQGGSGGGGLTGNGGNSAGSTSYGGINTGGVAFTGGAIGGLAGTTGSAGACRDGGFGGGGAGGYTGGGGGGYSGGGAGGDGGSGGGGSYNNGTNPFNTASANYADGIVIITYSGISAEITVDANLSAFSSCSGSVSNAQSFSVAGTGLTDDISLTAPTGYEISKSSGSGYGSSVTITQSSGTISSTTVYARLTSSATGSPSGNITATSSNANTRNIAVSGTVTAASVGGVVKW